MLPWENISPTQTKDGVVQNEFPDNRIPAITVSPNPFRYLIVEDDVSYDDEV